MFQYNREMFMFISAFVLTYVYFPKKFSILTYWGKRVTIVILPYIIWSFLYVRVNQRTLSLLPYIKTSMIDVLTGNASFQLYYIVLILQFYICFPLLLHLFKKVVKHPWITLSVCFIVQLIFFFCDYHFIQLPLNPSSSQLQQLVVTYQGRIFLSYFFYFVLGAYAAIYYTQIKAFLYKHGTYILPLYLIMFTLFALNYYIEISVSHISIKNAISVIQPDMLFYTIASILLLAWIVLQFDKKRNKQNQPRHAVLFRLLTEVVFGIYLVHGFFLNATRRLILIFHIHAAYTFPLLAAAIVVIITFMGSLIFCFIIVCIPRLNLLIGRIHPFQLNIHLIKRDIAFATHKLYHSLPLP